MKFKNASRCGPCLFDSSELGERGGELYICDAMCRIGLNRPVRGMSCLVVAAAVKVTHSLSIKGGEAPRIERA